MFSHEQQNLEYYTALTRVTKRISNDMNVKSGLPFIKEEVCTVLKQMNPIKAPGPNGFPVAFF